MPNQLNFNSFNKYPNQYFQHDVNSSFESEKELFRKLQTQLINIFGLEFVYCVVSVDITSDPIFGEDNNRAILRQFHIKGYLEQYPESNEELNLFGIEDLNIQRLFISKEHFNAMSQFNNDTTLLPVTSGSETSAYEQLDPKEGDLIKSSYEDKLYEVVHVKEESNIFQGSKETYELILKDFVDERLSLSATTSADLDSDVKTFVSKADILSAETSDAGLSATEDDDIFYDPSGSEESSNQDNLGGWFS